MTWQVTSPPGTDCLPSSDILGRATCRCWARRPLTSLLVGSKVCPTLTSAQPCQHGRPPCDKEKQSRSHFAVRCPDCNKLGKFLSNKARAGSCPLCRDQRSSVSQTSFQVEKTCCELLNQFKNIIMNLPHGRHNAPTDCGKSKGAPSI